MNSQKSYPRWETRLYFYTEPIDFASRIFAESLWYAAIGRTAFGFATVYSWLSHGRRHTTEKREYRLYREYGISLSLSLFLAMNFFARNRTRDGLINDAFPARNRFFDEKRIRLLMADFFLFVVLIDSISSYRYSATEWENFPRKLKFWHKCLNIEFRQATLELPTTKV